MTVVGEKMNTKDTKDTKPTKITKNFAFVTFVTFVSFVLDLRYRPAAPRRPVLPAPIEPSLRSG